MSQDHAPCDPAKSGTTHEPGQGRIAPSDPHGRSVGLWDSREGPGCHDPGSPEGGSYLCHLPADLGSPGVGRSSPWWMQSSGEAGLGRLLAGRRAADQRLTSSRLSQARPQRNPLPSQANPGPTGVPGGRGVRGGLAHRARVGGPRVPADLGLGGAGVGNLALAASPKSAKTRVIPQGWRRLGAARGRARVRGGGGAGRSQRSTPSHPQKAGRLSERGDGLIDRNHFSTHDPRQNPNRDAQMGPVEAFAEGSPQQQKSREEARESPHGARTVPQRAVCGSRKTRTTRSGRGGDPKQ